MPIRCGAGHGLRTDIPASASAVINHHRLTQSCLQNRLHDAHRGI